MGVDRVVSVLPPYVTLLYDYLIYTAGVQGSYP